MHKNYTQEQLDKALEKLPEELQETLYSIETSESVISACETYGVDDERLSQISYCVALVLLGLLPPSEFQETLEKEIKLPKVLAKTIGHEINRFVFYPVRPLLEELYKTSLTSPEEPTTTTKQKRTPTTIKMAPEKSPGKDVYREVIE